MIKLKKGKREEEAPGCELKKVALSSEKKKKTWVLEET